MVWTIVACIACIIVTRWIILARIESRQEKERKDCLSWSRWMWYAVNDRLKDLGLKAVWGPDFRVVVPDAEVLVDANRGEFEVYVLGLDQRGEPDWIYKDRFRFGDIGGREAAKLVHALVVEHQTGLLSGARDEVAP